MSDTQAVRAIAFGTVATRKWSPFRSPAFGRVSTIAKLSQALTVAPRHPTGEAGATNLPNLFARHHKLIAALAMVAIWAGTFHAIGRL